MRTQGWRIFLFGLLKFLALVTVAGSIGIALGMVLTSVSDDDDPAGATAATTAASVATDPLDQLRMDVLDARLFTDETPSGAREQRARVTVRIRGENSGAAPVTLERPLLRVGNVRIETDADAGALPGSQFAPLQPGLPQTVTLRFSLTGEATPKIVRDRRARVLIAGRSLAMRVKVQTPPG